MGGDDDEEGETYSAHAQRHAPQNQALNEDAGERREARNAGGGAGAEFRDPVDAMADLLEEERERRVGVNRGPDLVAAELARRRKGKEIQIQIHSPVGSAENLGRAGVRGLGIGDVGTSGGGLVGPSGGGRVRPSLGGGLVGATNEDLLGPSARGEVQGVLGPTVGPSVGPIVGPRAEEVGTGNIGQDGQRVLGAAISQYSSGSGSCDPGKCKEQVQEGTISSDDADSRIGTWPKERTVQQNPIIISGGTEEEDMDLGGGDLVVKGGDAQMVPKEENVTATQGEIPLGDRGDAQTKGKERLVSGEGTGVGYCWP